jgi:hypothetical protein
MRWYDEELKVGTASTLGSSCPTTKNACATDPACARYRAAQNRREPLAAETRPLKPHGEDDIATRTATATNLKP